METFTIDLSLTLNILELSQKISNLHYKKRNLYLDFISQEFFAIDDEYTNLFEIIIHTLSLNYNQSELESYFSSLDVDKIKLDLCLKACLDYLNDFD